MSKNFRDPLLGEMIGIAEVEKMTGISKATMRNWRKPELAHLAKFRGYQIVGTRDVMYRKADVSLWVQQNGFLGNNTTFAPLDAPNAIEAPFNNVEQDEAKTQLLYEVSQIVSDNAYFVWYANLWNINGEKFDSLWKPLMMKYRSLASGLPESELVHIPTSHRLSQPEWFTGAVPALREIYALFNGFELTEEEILSTPIGTVPPMKEKNR